MYELPPACLWLINILLIAPLKPGPDCISTINHIFPIFTGSFQIPLINKSVTTFKSSIHPTNCHFPCVCLVGSALKTTPKTNLFGIIQDLI